jgi:hypothetical protein
VFEELRDDILEAIIEMAGPKLEPSESEELANLIIDLFKDYFSRG